MDWKIILSLLAILASIATITGYTLRDLILLRLGYEFPVEGDIEHIYNMNGGKDGPLGRTVSKEKAVASSRFGTKGTMQRFSGEKDGIKGVSIYASEKGACVVSGLIGNWYKKYAGSTAGKLGFPVTSEYVDEEPEPGKPTRIQDFEGGSIILIYNHAPRIKLSS